MNSMCSDRSPEPKHQLTLQAARRLLKSRMRLFVVTETSEGWRGVAEVEEGIVHHATEAWSGVLSQWDLSDAKSRLVLYTLVEEAACTAVEDVRRHFATSLPEDLVIEALDKMLEGFDLASFLGVR